MANESFVPHIRILGNPSDPDVRLVRETLMGIPMPVEVVPIPEEIMRLTGGKQSFPRGEAVLRHMITPEICSLEGIVKILPELIVREQDAMIEELRREIDEFGTEGFINRLSSSRYDQG